MGIWIQSMSLGGAIDIAARRQPAPAFKILSFKGLCASCLTAAPMKWSRRLSNRRSLWSTAMPARKPSGSLGFQ